MAMTPRKIILFLLGALVAGGVAYYTGIADPAIKMRAEVAEPASKLPSEEDASASSQPQAALSETKKDRASGEPRESGAQAEGPEVDDSESAQLQKDVIVPAFDVLRVEPNGSFVVAGQAAPKAEVEVLSGSTVLATTQSGPAGDFVAVLDQALEPGDHNIVLRATSPENVAATSIETAIVSIPSAGSEDLVALVQRPGEPSRLITVPHREEDTPAGDSDEIAQPDGPEDAATADDGITPEGEGEGGPAVERPGESNAVAVDETEDQVQFEQDAASLPRDEPPVSETSADEASKLAESSREDSGNADGPQDDVSARAETQADGASSSQEPEEVSQEEIVPFIEAVEIDGQEIFVAGTAEPGRLVRIYANDILLGQTTVSPSGRFLIESERELPVGDYIIRADMLADDGVTVIARAAVPFERHTGEQIAAVAPEAAQRVPGSASAEGSGESDRLSGAEEGESERTISPDEDAASVRTAPSRGAIGSSKQQAEDSAHEPATPSSEPLERDLRRQSRSKSQPKSLALDGASGENSAVELAPALKPVDGAVIIRRGDTLWHISRRVYGHGIRYTTIYLANQEQIRDPDLIWPGQIFAVPEETASGQKANLEALGDQILTPEEAAAVQQE